MAAGDFKSARAMLRDLGLQGSSYYRTDEILYALGHCHVKLYNPQKALKAFSLLREYYASCYDRFPDLRELEKECQLIEAPDRENYDEEPIVDATPSNQTGANLQPLVTNVFYETDVRQALMDVSVQAKTSLVLGPRVQGFVTLELHDVPLEQALDRILRPLGCEYKKVGDYYLVGMAVPGSPEYSHLAETKPVVLDYLDAPTAAALLPSSFKDFLQLDEKSRAMAVTAPPGVMDEFSTALDAIDVPQQQFVIEIAVVELSEEARKVLGINWDWSGTKGNDSYRLSKITSSSHLAGDSSSLGVFSWGDFQKWGLLQDLNVTVEALARDGEAHFRANPKVTAQQGRQSTIRVGKEAYYSLVIGSVNYPYITLEKIATGVTLKIIPFMGATPSITNDIDVEISDVTGTGANDLPVTSVRSVQTRVEVANGHTFGIGGLVTESVVKTKDRIPLLGSIPVIGALFGRTEDTRVEEEIVILVTPHALIDSRYFEAL